MSEVSGYDTIEELGRRARRWIAIEELLFETLGRWARESDDPAVKRALATWCHRHAWHAQLWRERLPAVGDEVRDDVDTWLAPLRSTLEKTTAADAVTVVAGPVCTALEDAVSSHRDAIDPLLDGPTARVLDLIAADLARERDDFSHPSVSC